MKLKEIMTLEPQCVRPSTTLLEAHKLMADKGFRHLLVVEGEDLVGLIGERDIALHQERTGESIFSSPSDTVSMAMQAEVQTASPSDAVSMAARRMARSKIGCLPILDAERVIGLVTVSDILAVFPDQG